MRVLDRFVICIFVLIALSTLFPSACRACLWDDDTLRTEARGLPGLAEILTGRTERNPPLYYQMRLERVTAQLAADPDNLAAYDNAAVACDRLGRSDEAIEWMARKRAALNRNPDSEHEYRYLANLGTFHAHRWIRAGADPEDMADLETAKDLIADAIELNPDAHFGREKYQLLAIEWLLNPVSISIWHPTLLKGANANIDLKNKSEAKDAIEGLTGLMVLGDAWESFDILEALYDAIAGMQHASLARVAVLRLAELRTQGKTSLHPDWDPELMPPVSRYIPRNEEDIDAWFTEARSEADAWRSVREQYMLAKLQAGEHPDTHPDFWNDWKSPSNPPPMPFGIVGLQGNNLLVSYVVGFGLILVGLIAIRRSKKRKSRSQVVD
jgi:tetratricopeptide (TPR) repeat protein